MARITSHVHLAVRKIRIDIRRHRDHVPRDFLLRVIVTSEIPLHVAMIALHAESGRIGAHDLDHFRPRGNFQNFQVRRGRRRWPLSSLILFVLRA
jgi:hypothetical protein